MKTIKLMTTATLLLLYSCSSTETKSTDDPKTEQQVNEIADVTSELISKQLITVDSSIRIMEYWASLNDNDKAAYVAKLKNPNAASSKSKMTNDEYIKYFSDKINAITLNKLLGQAPLYGKYADAFAEVLSEMDDMNTKYEIRKDKKIDNLYKSADKKNAQALKDYMKYGEPDEDLIYITAACKTALPQVLKDPDDFEILKDKYYLKQTSEGYNYKLLVKAKNSFNAYIQQEFTFSLKYSATDKGYYVTKVK